MKAVVVGAGAWGTAFSSLLAARGHDVTLACRDPEQARAIEETGHNPRHLTSADLSGVSATTVDDPALAGADLHVIAVPSQAFGQVVRALPGAAPVLSLTKGLDPETGGRLSELVERRGSAVLSGPNFAQEVADGLPAAAVIASKDHGLALELQEAVNSLTFRVYVNEDVVGVELCAAAKNVMALAAGGVDGLGLGDNAKAALIARGLAEMARLGEACGARTRDVLRARRDGRSDRHLLEPSRPQPRGRRADRERRQPGRCGCENRHRGRADDRSCAARSLASARDRAADHGGRLPGA